jgi:hypothetical protein
MTCQSSPPEHETAPGCPAPPLAFVRRFCCTLQACTVDNRTFEGGSIGPRTRFETHRTVERTFDPRRERNHRNCGDFARSFRYGLSSHEREGRSHACYSRERDPRSGREVATGLRGPVAESPEAKPEGLGGGQAIAPGDRLIAGATAGMVNDASSPVPAKRYNLST